MGDTEENPVPTGISDNQRTTKCHTASNGTSRNTTAYRRFCGFIKYLAKFMPKLSEVTEPFRNLTCKENEWNWTYEHEMAFK